MNQNITSWEEIKLAKVGKIITGKTPPTNQTKYYNGEYPFITPTDMNDNRHIITERYLSDKAAKRYPNYLLPKNSVCFTCIGATIGKMCKTNSKSFTNQQINSVVVNQHYDSDFIYYLLKTYKENIVNLAAGAATPIVNKTLFSNIEILVPKLPIQRTIGLYLAAFDDLIENNQTRIGLLEEMAQLLYREWFVEFRFPGYEKHKFVDSELGKIPEGWKMATLREHLKLDKGVSYSGDGLTEEGNPMVNLKSISVDGRYVRGSDKPYSGDYKPRHVLKPGDIVLANTDMTQNGNVVGKAAIVPVLNTDKEIICSHHIYAVRIKKNTYLKRNYLLNLLNSYYFHGHAKGYAVGTTVLGLSADSIYRFSFAQPDKEVADLFEEKTQEIYQLIENLENQNIVLQHTRDLLLPKLMSGEIDVSDIDIESYNT